MQRALAAAWLAAGIVLAGCTADPAPSITAPNPDPSARQACEPFMAALPQVLAGQSGEVQTSALVAHWGGRNAIVVRCGVPRPAGLEATSRCDVVNDIGWFTEEVEGGYRFTTIGRAVHLEVAVPHAYAPEADVLVELTDAVRAVAEVKPCV